MATRDERRALGFLAAIALVGAGVRVVGVQHFEAEVIGASPHVQSAPLAERALEAQIAAVDSARAAPPRKRTSKRVSKRVGKPRAPRARSSRAGDEPTLTRRDEPRPPLDINVASAADLERLPRIGPALARRIVAWRDEHGPFASLDDLRHVRGIGPSTVRLLEPLVTFSGRLRPLLSEGPPSFAKHPRSAH